MSDNVCLHIKKKEHTPCHQVFKMHTCSSAIRNGQKFIFPNQFWWDIHE